MRKNVEFNSKGSKIRGVLVTPDSGKGPFPIAVMGGGWCYVKEIVLPHYAEAIVKAGVAVLMFDYRGLGESEGEPRQHIDPWGQIEDYKNAISFVMKQPENPEELAAARHALEGCCTETIHADGASFDWAAIPPRPDLNYPGADVPPNEA